MANICKLQTTWKRFKIELYYDSSVVLHCFNRNNRLKSLIFYIIVWCNYEGFLDNFGLLLWKVVNIFGHYSWVTWVSQSVKWELFYM